MAMTTETTIIRIQEQPAQENQHNALVIFEPGVQYSVQIRDPFADNEQAGKDLEKELEWYFEEYLSFPFTPKVRAQHVAESIRSYGEALFTQIFANDGARDQYRQAMCKGLHTLRLEIAGSPRFSACTGKRSTTPCSKRPSRCMLPSFVKTSTDKTFQPLCAPRQRSMSWSW
jgi:hypothetical protein